MIDRKLVLDRTQTVLQRILCTHVPVPCAPISARRLHGPCAGGDPPDYYSCAPGALKFRVWKLAQPSATAKAPNATTTPITTSIVSVGMKAPFSSPRDLSGAV